MKVKSIAASALVAASAVAAMVLPAAASHRRDAPAFAHTAPCRYPDGWNAADYSDDLAGRPKDRYHQCVVGRDGQLLDSDGQPTD